jgi:hypothetical protein
VGTPNVTSRNNRGAVFSVRGRCRRLIRDTASRLLGLGMRRLGDWKTSVEDLISSKGKVACPEEELVCDFTCAVIQRYWKCAE